MATPAQVPRRELTRRDLFEKWCTIIEQEADRRNALLNFLENNYQIDRTRRESIVNIFLMEVNRMWKKVSRKRDRFESRYEDWLNSEIKLFDPVDPNVPKAKGRPLKSFSDSSIKTKKRRVEGLLKNHTAAELQFAANSVSRAPLEEKKNFTPLDSLALMLDLNLSTRKYRILQSAVNAIHKGFFPSYYSIKQLTNDLLPANIAVDDSQAEVNLQELLNKTTTNIIKSLGGNEINFTNATLHFKWGFDGSSGHSLYKMPFEDSSATDAYIFLIAFTPLKLCNDTDMSDIWTNPRPSSTHYCRPIKFIFAKENDDLIKSEECRMKELFSRLNPLSFESNSITVNINYSPYFTMIDGNVAKVLTDTDSAAKCVICGARPVEMNKGSVVTKIPRTENYSFGLSTLHSWIRFYECIIHIAYRLPFRKWQARGEENQKLFEERKLFVRSELRKKMGLIVDVPRPGYGTSNDGNSASRFFSDPDLSSEITGVDKNLIYNFGLILRIISSGFRINVPQFDALLLETKDLYLSKYDWYYMPSTVHKILVHGAAVIDFFNLPIGLLSEEALEARHKEIRKMRLENTRKNSRINSNLDLISRLLLTSDPLLSIKRRNLKKQYNDGKIDISKYIVCNHEEKNESIFNIENISLSDEDRVSDSD